MQAVLRVAGPKCKNTSNCVENVLVNSTFIEELLSCFLVNSSCSLFASVTNTPYSNSLACKIFKLENTNVPLFDNVYFCSWSASQQVCVCGAPD